MSELKVIAEHSFMVVVEDEPLKENRSGVVHRKY